MRYLISTILFCVIQQVLYAYTINIHIDKPLLEINSIAWSIQDFKSLLENTGVEKVFINDDLSHHVEIWIKINNNEEKTKNYNTDIYLVSTPDRSYHWVGKDTDSTYHLELATKAKEGVQAGIYGLLQEVFNFNFYHPRASQYPDMKKWVLQGNFDYQSHPRLNKMGFHLHTMHPIELTEALLDIHFPQGEKRIKEYIDWLARNRQNYMEFNLLESINRKQWPQYAAKWVEYMKDRDIIPGLDLSLHMKQQKAFQLYRLAPQSFRTKKNQIKRQINILSVADWKYWNVEFSATEFSSGNAKKKNQLRAYAHQLLKEKGIVLTGREHVVKPEAMINKVKKSIQNEKDTLDKYRGTMIHTVMFYGLNDTLAPVYGNKNLLHMRDKLLTEMSERETWYYPESAYWVTFDNSIPMFLSPYLNSRLSDILYCDSIGIEGHLTFSSGWEWNYWLVDWSIANWSWESQINHENIVPSPEQYLNKLVEDTLFQKYFTQVNLLQNRIIKQQNLIQYLTATTVTDEMPLGKNLPFHPIPDLTYAYISNHATLKEIDSLQTVTLPIFKSYLEEYEKIRSTLPSHLNKNIESEIVRSMDMVALRVNHRMLTLSFLLAQRKTVLENNKNENVHFKYLEEAAQVRAAGIQIVRQQEAQYRYSIKELATQWPNHTAYEFGYLYPVHNLHFWEREEKQAISNKWKFWYQNIWNVWKIMGIIK